MIMEKKMKNSLEGRSLDTFCTPGSLLVVAEYGLGQNPQKKPLISF